MTVADSPARPPAEAIAVLQRHGLATASSGLAAPVLRSRVLDGHALHRVSGKGVVVGPVVTAWNVWGSSDLNATLFETLRPGDVLVLAGDTQRALWGDNAARRAMQRDVAGVIVDGNVRDVDALAESGLSVWARRVYVGEGPRSGGPGAINVPLVVRGAVVEPGDIAIADGDGIGFVPWTILDEVVAATQARAGEDARVVAEIDRTAVK